LQRYLPILVPASSLVFLLFGAVGGSTMDDEEYRNVVASMVLHARALLDGYFPFWTSDLGLGIPLPMHPTFFLHPLMPLFGVLTPGTAVRLFYVVHALIGAAGCWVLMRHLGVRPWVQAVATSTWLLANPALTYALTDLWLSHFYGWSLYPWLLLYALRILDDDHSAHPWRAGLQLGVVAGLLAVGGHFGQIPVLVIPLLVMCAAEPSRTIRRIGPLLVAAAIGSVIGAPVIVRLMREMPLFPDLPRYTVEVAIDGRSAADLVLRPLLDFRGSDLRLGSRGVMQPFFGGPMFVLALAYIAGAKGLARFRWGLVVGFVASAILLFQPQLIDRELTSGMYLFRDPLTLFGIALGGLALEALWRRLPRAAAGAAALQIVVLVVCAWPFVRGAWYSRAEERRALAHTPITLELRAWTRRLPGRWYLAPQLDGLSRGGGLADDGLWRDVWIYRGLPVVNGSFKGISTDALYPSGSLPIGRIDGEAATAGSAATLGVLGIGAVLAMENEPVAPELEEMARFGTKSGVVRLLRNPAAWPGAAFVAAETVAAPLSELRECRARGLLCRDFSTVAIAGPDVRVELTRRHGTLRARFAPSDRERLLLVSEMYRPEWTARSSAGALAVRDAWQGLISVSVPPGVPEVELRYRPTLIMALTLLSGLVLLGVSATLAWQTGRARARA
jgi:hypothetical protein